MSIRTFAGDESGDVSFSFDKGASRYYTFAAVATVDPDALRLTLNEIRRASNLRADYEFHLNALSSRQLRRRAYQALAAVDYETWAIAVDKRILPDPFKLLSGPEFYVFFATELVRSIPFSLRCGSTLILDQFGSPATVRREIKRALRVRDIEAGFKQIQIARSRSEPLVQVADLMAGALLRKLRGETEAFDYVGHKFRSIVEYRG